MIRKCELVTTGTLIKTASVTFVLFFVHVPCSFVGTFIPRKERLKDMGQNPRFTNLYVKNFGDDLGDDELGELFSAHGKVMSAVVMKDKMSGKSLCFGFVSFEDHMSAAKVSVVAAVGEEVLVCFDWTSTLLPHVQAMDAMNNQKTAGGSILYVSRAQKKKERQLELMHRHEAKKMERYNR